MSLPDAIKLNNFNRARQILMGGADPNARGRNTFAPLHYAVRIGSCRLVQLLLEYGADPNVMTDTGLTPIRQLRQDDVYGSNMEIAEMLRDYGATDSFAGSCQSYQYVSHGPWRSFLHYVARACC